MINNIEIEPYISSSSYFFEKENSRCYISNEKKHTELMLEGVFADLWYVVLTTQNYEKIKEYAKLKGIEDSLDDFINELQITGLISGGDSVLIEDSCSQTQEEREQEKKAYDNMISDKHTWLFENKFLNQLTVELSYKCNLFCKHCYNDKTNFKDSIDFETAKKFIDDAINLGAGSIYFTSGECTIHPDFIKILRYIREQRKSFSFVTNGQALYDDDVLFENIVNLYPHEIKISLYSMNPEIHDYITGVKGSQKKTVAVIRKLRERNITVRINYFQMSLNKNCFSDVLKFKNEVGADMSADIFFIDNKNNSNSFVKATDQQMYELFKDKNSPYHNLLEYKNPCYGNGENPACKSIKNMIAISPSLDVYPCLVLKYKLANLSETSLNDIWKNKIDKFWNIYKVKNLVDCKDCEYFEYCTYCPCLGMYENGFLRKSDICCKITKIRMSVLKEMGKYPEKLQNIEM